MKKKIFIEIKPGLGKSCILSSPEITRLIQKILRKNRNHKENFKAAR